MPSSPASRRALNRSWILVFKNNLTQESSCDYRQSIVPRARANVLRLFPSTGVLHQQMVPAPPAKIPAEIVLVGNRVSVIGVKSHGREIKSPVRNFLRNILVGREGRLASGSQDTSFTDQVVWRPHCKLFL